MVTLYFSRIHTSGLLVGLVTHDSLSFASVRRAAAWVRGVKTNALLDYELSDHTFQRRRCDK